MTTVDLLGQEEWDGLLDEAQPHGPLTPQQAQKRAKRLAAANAKVADAKASAAIRIQAAQRKVADI